MTRRGDEGTCLELDVDILYLNLGNKGAESYALCSTKMFQGVADNLEFYVNYSRD